MFNQKKYEMGFSGCNIPGHSGTSQKNRKAFSKTKELHLRSKKQSTHVASDKAIVEERLKKNLKANRIVRMISLVSLIFILLVSLKVWGYANDDLKVFTNNSTLFGQFDYQYHHVEVNRSIAQKHLYAADQFFCSGELLKAQDEYVHAIRIFPRNESVIMDLTAVLNQRCLTEGVFCNKAKEYQEFLKYLRNKKSLSSSDFME